MIGVGAGILAAIIKLGVVKIGEDLFFKGFRSILNMVFQETFRLSLLKLTLLISPAVLIDYLVQVGYGATKEAFRDVLSAQNAVTSYNIDIKPSGILVAKNLSPSTLRNFPLQLPRTANLPVSAIIPGPNDLARHVQTHMLEANAAYVSLYNLQKEGDTDVCPICYKVINIRGGSPIGHAPNCPRNPYLVS